MSGLAALLASSAAIASAGSVLVPAASPGGPAWVLGVYGGGTGIGAPACLALLIIAFGGYLCVLAGATSARGRTIWAAIVLATLTFALAPPLLSQDVFSYISYARLGTEHGLDPYAHAPSAVPGDPVFGLVGWPESTSAYGPLFTLLTYPLAPLGPAGALWALKAVAALSVLGTALLVGRAAPARGIDGRWATAFVALNPLVLVHVIGGAHNDALMVLLAMAGVAALLAGADRAAGATLVTAAGVKAAALPLAPFALLGSRRRPRFLAGAAALGVLVGAAGLAAFGADAFAITAISGENQGRIAHRSVPYLAARMTGADPQVLRIGALGLYAISLAMLLRWVWRGADWLRAAGWAYLGLLVASSWVLPWYLLWLLPLAALSRDRALCAGALALTALHLATRLPL